MCLACAISPSYLKNSIGTNKEEERGVMIRHSKASAAYCTSMQPPVHMACSTASVFAAGWFDTECNCTAFLLLAAGRIAARLHPWQGRQPQQGTCPTCTAALQPPAAHCRGCGCGHVLLTPRHRAQGPEAAKCAAGPGWPSQGELKCGHCTMPARNHAAVAYGCTSI